MTNPSPEHNVRDFLAARGLPADVVDGAVGRAFGPPLLATVTGSVPLGFGNHSSDLDIFVIVASDEVSPLPIPYHEAGLHIDVRYFSAAVTEGWEAMLVAAVVDRTDPLDRDGLISARFALENASRFALGYTFVDGGGDRSVPVPDASLRQFATNFWLLESLRNRWVAAVAADAGNHRFASLRQTDALLARLEAHCARRGLYYVGAKWIGEKLSVLGERTLLEELGAILRCSDPAEAESIGSRLTRSGVPDTDALDPTDVVLTVASDVQEFDVLGRRLATRWSTRGAWIDGPVPAMKPHDLLWRGDALDPVPDDVAALVLADFTWVSTCRGADR